jgi:hypothetical protein
MSKLRLRAAVGLFTGHTTLRAHLYKFVHIVCDCPILACKRYRVWDNMFLKLEILRK